MSLPTVPISDLLAERAWLERLALCLTQDTAAAEDLLQTTWVHVIARPPSIGGPVRRWLGEVMRNVRRATFRTDTRRLGREVAILDAEPGSRSPEDLVQEVEQRRRLICLVLQLDEPYRNVVLRHFYEGLSSVEIARRDGCPAGTVRWRLMEGLNRLRQQLDAQEDGQRARWQQALLPVLAHHAQRLSSRWRFVAIATVVGAAAIFSVARSNEMARTAGGGSRPVAAQGLRDQTVLANGATTQGENSHRLATAADREDCLAELLLVRTELAEAEQTRQRLVGPGRLFEENAPNDPGRTILLPFITEALASVEGAPTFFDLQCRGRYCKVRFLFDGDLSSMTEPKQLMAKLRTHPALAARSEIMGWGPGGGMNKDALSGAPITEVVAILLLTHSSAAPKGAVDPEPAPEAELRWPSTAATCQAELRHVRAAVIEKTAAIQAAKPGKTVFQEAPGANIPALEEAMAARMKRVFGSDAPSIEIYCRTGACRLKADNRVLPDWQKKLHLDPWFRKHTRQSHDGGSAWTKIYLAVDVWPS